MHVPASASSAGVRFASEAQLQLHACRHWTHVEHYMQQEAVRLIFTHKYVTFGVIFLLDLLLLTAQHQGTELCDSSAQLLPASVNF